MTIDFLDVGCADAIHIRFDGTDGIPRNILIDGGSEKGELYTTSLRVRINEIINIQKEIIDLWIITHIDDDHIGGVLRLLKDEELLLQSDLSRTTFWFNYSIWDYDTGIRTDNLKNVKQGITLREYLIKNSNVIDHITNSMGTIDLWGAKITILSPDAKRYKELLGVWLTEEIKLREREISALKKGRKNDYERKIEDFDISKEVKDDSEENGSSIAFVLEFHGESILLSADSHPWVLESSLERIWGGEKVSLKYMQIPHHGSRYNLSNSLLNLVDCHEYIISADAYNRSNLPNKESLVKVLHANSDKNIVFNITQKNDLTESIFKVDTDYKVDVRFPEPGYNCLHFTLGCEK